MVSCQRREKKGPIGSFACNRGTARQSSEQHKSLKVHPESKKTFAMANKRDGLHRVSPCLDLLQIISTSTPPNPRPNP
jgi:hypothetical protein